MTTRRTLVTAVAAAPLGAMLPASANAQSVRPPGVVPPNRAFATLPFSSSDADLVELTSTWETAVNEIGIVGGGHSALDFEAPYGTPVRAMADGWAVASYQSYIIRGYEAHGPFDPDDPSNLETAWRDPYTGREDYIAAGGLFVELQMDAKVPGSDQNYATQLFHLSAFNRRKVTWLPPIRLEDSITWNGGLFVNWYPELIPKPQAEIRRVGKRVRRGDVLGWTGDSGIGFGWYDDLNPETGEIAERNRDELPPWDPQGAGEEVPIEDASMVHAQFYGGRNLVVNDDGTISYRKVFTFDGLDKYDQIEGDPGIALDEIEVGPKPIFKSDRHGRLLLTDEC